MSWELDHPEEERRIAGTINDEPVPPFYAQQSDETPTEKSWTGSSITLENVERHEAGMYRCRADNGLGDPSTDDVQVVVNYAPEIHVDQDWIHSGEGNDVNLTCNIQGDPKPTVEWQRRMEDGKRFTLDPSVTWHIGNTYTLDIKNLSRGDFSVYFCKAWNELGETEGSIEVSGEDRQARQRNGRERVGNITGKAPRVANQAKFKSEPDGDQSNSYRLVWEVESYSPIESYELEYRKHNETESLPWSTIAIPANSSFSYQHSMAYTLEGLTEATIYDVKVRVKNRFGWNRESEITTFTTLSGYGIGVGIDGRVLPPHSLVFNLLSPYELNIPSSFFRGRGTWNPHRLQNIPPPWPCEASEVRAEAPSRSL
ncbi:unnamed protein product [Darwinula stevensoni]|uniref:Uncharacterized protein n=1 Tax=Darwinula stevensoni TaxID=69355 RepID=A0A7R8XKJ3_9CRUS|nr:unnamed protein product [Darwinula stevensoni]CAG0893232.1 unnamed protein product [Darwinula stevensoni]